MAGMIAMTVLVLIVVAMLLDERRDENDPDA